MRTRAIAWVLPATLPLLALLLGVAPAAAAAPRIVLVAGPLLARPVVMADWDANLRLFVSAGDNPRAQLEPPSGRPYVTLALFSGPTWDAYVRQGKPLERLRPEQADGEGRFYPAVGREPALLVLKEVQTGSRAHVDAWSVREVAADGLAVLAAHGIPTRAAPAALPAAGGPPRGILPATGIVGASAAAVGLALRFRRSRR